MHVGKYRRAPKLAIHCSFAGGYIYAKYRSLAIGIWEKGLHIEMKDIQIRLECSI
jgi:hypothetical protein